MLFGQVLLTAVASAAVTALLTPAVIRLAFRLRAVDVPGGRKRHARSTPRLGGVAIVAGLLLVGLPSLGLLILREPSGLTPREVSGFCIAAALMFLIGLTDDLFEIGVLPKAMFQILAASIAVATGWQFDTFRFTMEGPSELGALGPIVSVLWIVGVANAINFVDGLDGLAAGIVAIIGSSLMILAAIQGSTTTVVATSAVVGCCLGFLRHNRAPARIYMGDSGSLTLGFLLATSSLSATPSVKASTFVAILVPLLALGLPVIDTLLVMWYRFLRGHSAMNRFVRMFRADRRHLHHLLVDYPREHHRVVLLIYSLAVLFCGMALVVAASQSWRLGLGFLVVEIATIVLVRRVGLTSKARHHAREELSRISRIPPSGELKVGRERRRRLSRARGKATIGSLTPRAREP